MRFIKIYGCIVVWVLLSPILIPLSGIILVYCGIVENVKDNRKKVENVRSINE